MMQLKFKWLAQECTGYQQKNRFSNSGLPGSREQALDHSPLLLCHDVHPRYIGWGVCSCLLSVQCHVEPRFLNLSFVAGAQCALPGCPLRTCSPFVSHGGHPVSPESHWQLWAHMVDTEGGAEIIYLWATSPFQLRSGSRVCLVTDSSHQAAWLKGISSSLSVLARLEGAFTLTCHLLGAAFLTIVRTTGNLSCSPCHSLSAWSTPLFTIALTTTWCILYVYSVLCFLSPSRTQASWGPELCLFAFVFSAYGKGLGTNVHGLREGRREWVSMVKPVTPTYLFSSFADFEEIIGLHWALRTD